MATTEFLKKRKKLFIAIITALYLVGVRETASLRIGGKCIKNIRFAFNGNTNSEMNCWARRLSDVWTVVASVYRMTAFYINYSRSIKYRPRPNNFNWDTNYVYRHVYKLVVKDDEAAKK